LKILDKIPFEPDQERLMEAVRIEPGSEDAAGFEKLLSQAVEVAAPKAIFNECFIGQKTTNAVEIGGATFTSTVLRKNLDEVERVFAYVATCGRELDELDIGADEFLAPFWLDAIKSEALRAGVQYLNEYLDHTYALGKTANMSPGSGDASIWPIEQQEGLFSLIGDVTSAIGVELTPSFLMVPNKTISGIRFPTEIDFRTCQLCHRQNCPSRAAPFDRELWESIGHE
jgi:hypothetical protein